MSVHGEWVREEPPISGAGVNGTVKGTSQEVSATWRVGCSSHCKIDPILATVCSLLLQVFRLHLYRLYLNCQCFIGFSLHFGQNTVFVSILDSQLFLRPQLAPHTYDTPFQLYRSVIYSTCRYSECQESIHYV